MLLLSVTKDTLYGAPMPFTHAACVSIGKLINLSHMALNNGAK